MDFQRQVVCPENEDLMAFLKNKWQEMAQNPKGISDNLNNTLYKACTNVCNSKNPIKSLRDFAEIKGVGKWILKLMQGFFNTDSGAAENEDIINKGKRIKGTRRYMPQKNSVAYALLISLYRGTTNGNEFMRRQELIDAAEASGLSRVPIAPEKGKGKPGKFGSSPQEWYSGWSCMKTLITKGLVVKSSCPAKYMLTEEGKEAAQECLSRSKLVDCCNSSDIVQIFSGLEPKDSDILKRDNSDLVSARANSSKDMAFPSFPFNSYKKPIDIPPECLDRFIQMGFSGEQTTRAFLEASEASQTQDISSLWPAVLCHLREDQVYGLPVQSNNARLDQFADATTCKLDSNASDNTLIYVTQSEALKGVKSPVIAAFDESGCALKACSFMDKQGREPFEAKSNVLAFPPLDFGERFEDAYVVILVLDDREQFASKGSRSRKIIDNICAQFKIQIEVRRLPVGDAIWIARHKSIGTEYVLDFVVERKNVDDLRLSIRDNRYKDQKLRLMRCGLKKMIYLVEGDPNSCEAAESIKTACFTTEILEGFDVQRTSGLADTLRKYGYLTQAIYLYYKSLDSEHKRFRVCPRYGEFIRRCEDLDKMTVSDVFAIQLMQVPQVTEEVTIAVLQMYPTLLALAHAYSLLDGDVCAQEEMLKKQSNKLIGGVASKNIFQLIWDS
ncbi:hypothetical protein ACH5RR_001000 [Cinchona calisaya]|uniref:Crossover junction endonuclease MUS81 n=1 Tax=Cinchona calisaya TaxID=153742 RepID=A0ABD3B3C4_9GENT